MLLVFKSTGLAGVHLKKEKDFLQLFFSTEVVTVPEIVITGISLTVDTSNVTSSKEERTVRFLFSQSMSTSNLRRRSRGSASSRQGTAIAITHIEKERLENLTSRHKTLSRARNTASIVAKVQHQKELSRDVNSLAGDEISAECVLQKNQEHLDSPTEVSVRTANRKIHPSRPGGQVSHL